MTIHLDSSFLIRALIHASEEAEALSNWLKAGESFSMSAIAWAEFMSGPLDRDEEAFARVLIAEPLPVTGSDAERAAPLFNATGRRRGTLNDCLIAATAIGDNSPLATSNVSDFRRLASHGLRFAYPVKQA